MRFCTKWLLMAEHIHNPSFWDFLHWFMACQFRSYIVWEVFFAPLSLDFFLHCCLYFVDKHPTEKEAQLSLKYLEEGFMTNIQLNREVSQLSISCQILPNIPFVTFYKWFRYNLGWTFPWTIPPLRVHTYPNKWILSVIDWEAQSDHITSRLFEWLLDWERPDQLGLIVWLHRVSPIFFHL